VKGRWAGAGIAALVITLSSCHGSGNATLPKPTPVINIEMTEYNFTYDHAVPSGHVVFRLVNKGHLVHQPLLFPLTKDIPPIQQQVRGTKRLAVTPFAGVGSVAPGGVGAFAVDLLPGQRYGFVDFARTPDGRSDASLGMATEFRPVGA
jgi:hypothetical protein